MKETIHTPQSVVADEIWQESDLWDLDDCGMEAAAHVIARLERNGFVVVPKKITREMACAFEDCAPPSAWVNGDPHGAIDRLISDYQPEWDRVLAAVTVTQDKRQ